MTAKNASAQAVSQARSQIQMKSPISPTFINVTAADMMKDISPEIRRLYVTASKRLGMNGFKGAALER